MQEYNPLDFETELYDWWEKSGFFKAEDKSEKPPYCIVIPPPNVTGVLHMGHALTNTIQDILIRYHRMKGFNTLWLPGTDHAGIATQAVVERKLKRNNLSRHEMGRKKFLEKVWEWKENYGKRITNQLRRIGSSLDWERERFTMDKGLSDAVKEVFVRLYEEKLLYRDNRLINWCPSCRTALSNLEVEHETHEGNFWYIKYPLKGKNTNSLPDYLTVATTRPETMLGDTAVAVNPHPEKELRNQLHKLESQLDERGESPELAAQIDKIKIKLHPENLAKLEKLASAVGHEVLLPLTGKTIPIVADIHADPAFGTGAVKITPGHDFNDFEVSKRQELEIINILNEDGTLNHNVPAKYQGMSVTEARKEVVAQLENGEYLLKTEEHTHEVGHCSRCDEIVEPLLSLQWFVKTKPLAEKALKAVKEGETEIIPEMWKKTYYHWLENIEDWCISRQLWWGHQIPVWYCPDNHITVSRGFPEKCQECDSKDIRRDEDVLDTWFSSALWPFSTLGWPEQTDALATFYPNSVMETGFDILFFWVARMMMMGIHFMGEVPFKSVFLHAMVRDAEGRKMSKSLGNTIDPLDVINGISKKALLQKVEAALPPESEKENRKKRILKNIAEKFPDGIETHGTDALRFTLAIMAAQGRDIKLDMARIGGYRAFANKIWQAHHGLIFPHLKEKPTIPDPDNFSLPDRWIMTRLHQTIIEVNQAVGNFQINDAAESIYQFFWHELCDWYLEFSKSSLYGHQGEQKRQTTLGVLATVADYSLRLLHPFMPFITEKLWQQLPGEKAAPSIMISSYPTEDQVDNFPVSLEKMEILQQAIIAIRAVRGENNIPPSTQLQVQIRCDDKLTREVIQNNRNLVTGKLTNVNKLEFVKTRPEKSAATPLKGGEIFIPLEGLVDFDEEIDRLEKLLKKSEKKLLSVRKKLDNPKFMANAPDKVVELNRKRLQENQAEVSKISKSLNHFKDLLS
ncbi:MAG: valine--tRNA ligase [Deltaproteobacteria bacterium]|jgi:valyl-tRNA synthetase|nr:valine--tRNA ligase [Deltaproteobacteria bacterium]